MSGVTSFHIWWNVWKRED